MTNTFRIGISPDFYVDAKGYFEDVVEKMFAGAPGVEYASMPPQPNKTATPEALDQFDAVVALAIRVTPESVIGVNRLAVISRWGVGFDAINVDALTAADIMLCNTPKGVRRPVAEAILTFAFALSKQVFQLDRMTRAGKWRGDMPGLLGDIRGCALGSVGCGNIARELFGLARPLGFTRLLACDPFVTQEQVKDLGVELVDMDTVFRESDFVSVNTYLNDRTRGLVGERHFRLMKPSAYFINTARGGIVQHDALVKALKEKWIAGAGIDVFPTEPPPKDDPLFALDNVIVSPHALAWTNAIMHDNGVETCSHVLKVAHGEVPDAVVNREVLDRPGFRKKLESYRQRATAVWRG